MNIQPTAKACVSVLLGSFLFAGGAPPPALAQTSQPAPSSTPAQSTVSQWQAFTPAKGGFTVTMPGQPTERTQTLNTPAGDMNTYFYSSSVNGGKVSYTVSYVDLPEGAAGMPPALLLEAIASGLTGDERVKVLSEKVISLDSHPGREFKLESPTKSIVRHRAYLVKQRVYQVVAEVPVAEESAFGKDIERFLESFKLQ
ncbi:MAG: hypothetical protein IGS48_10925 [Oscillatoriales cyanobacterium C42_A2020_001]|nr:hypothetical protein [Leptolyngbyaceae cyanobacterium C42_A2020_001]